MVKISYANSEVEQEDSPSWALSMAAAVPSGIIKIGEGVATLGAALLDLGVDEDRVEAVEQYFDDINPFDELAEATAIGKITELIVNIGVPGGLAFKAASGLGKATIAAQKAGTYLSKAEKARRFGQGALGAGLAEGIAVGDVQDAGTFGDFLGGPTKIKRDDDSAANEILNRLKFGVEGMAFTGAFGAAGKLVSKMREVRGTNKAKRGLEKGIDKLDSYFRANGLLTPEGFDIKMTRIGRESADTNVGERAMVDIDRVADKIIKSYRKVATEKVTGETRNDILKKMNEVLMSGESDTILNAAGKKLLKDVNSTKMPLDSRPFTEQQFIRAVREGKYPNIDLKKYTTVINKDKKLRPIFGEVDEFKIDKTTGRPGTTKEFKTGKKIYDVQLGPMNQAKKEALRKLLKTKYKANDKDIQVMFDQFDKIRGKWSELFTIMGNRLTPASLKQFERMIPRYMNDVLDRGYEYVKANTRDPIQLAKNIRPTKELIKNAIKEFKDIAKSKNLKLSDELAADLVDDVWKGAYLPKGFTLGKTTAPGQVRFEKGVPSFMKDSIAKTLTNETLLDPKYNRLYKTNISELSGVSRDAINRLLGKSTNPMATIVEGTNNLSSQVRSGQFFDDLILKNNELKKNYDDWLAAGGRASGRPEPPIPFLYNDTADAIKYAGGTADDFAPIAAKEGDAARQIDPWVDKAAVLKNIDEDSAIIAGGKDKVEELLNPLQGKFALKDYAASFQGTKQSSRSIPQQIYNSLILYPKGLSQMSKTILAPFTHARNFISATAFASANGILPFGNTKDVKAAWNALQARGFGTRIDNEFYQELLELGVVNSNVQLKQVADLLEDVDFGSTLNKLNSDWGLNRFLKGLKKIKRGAEDYYTAEDDFWKIFTYLGEKSRLGKAYDKAGLKLGQEFVDMNGVKQIYNDQYLKKEAANLVKNNVPNYAFVSDFIKGLRKLPVGNFVAFPAEIIRTSSNIVETALKEINYSTIINGKKVNPLRGRGIQRLTGMALTTAALPLGTVAAAQAIYNVADEEIDAMRRYVADWSKNSVLVPFKDEDGKLSYIDFSHLNAYDTVTRPIQTVLNAVNSGRADEDGLVDDFILGMVDSTKEIASPFISESIWTAGITDIFVREGLTRDGRRLWNPRDSIGDKISKSISHLIDTQMPLNWKQMQRLGLSIKPVDSEGRFDERGNQYEFGNELAGIAGLRRVEVNPEKSFNYKITDFKKGIRDSRNLFTAATLKGGPISAEEIVDAYINANRSLYEVNRELYQDIEAAKILGMSDSALYENMENRGERRAYNSIVDGEFRPLRISKDVEGIFENKARELGLDNPFFEASMVIDGIQNILEKVPLGGDLFPNIPNPLRKSTIPNVVERANQIIGNNPANVAMATAPATTGFIGQANVNIDPVTRLTPNEEVLLNPLEKYYRKKERTTTKLT